MAARRSDRPLPDQVATLLHKLALAYAAEAAPDKSGLDLLATETLLAIEQLPVTDRTPPHLAARLGINAVTLNKVLHQLREEGYLAQGARILTWTPEGAHRAAAAKSITHYLLGGLSKLKDKTLRDLLRVTTQQLKERVARQQINPVQLCATCQYFEPYAHTNSDAPHHCHLIDAPFCHPKVRPPTPSLLSIKRLSAH